MAKLHLFILFILFQTGINAQQLTQTVSGRVVDKESKSPLPGAVIRLATDTTNKAATTSDADGYFKLLQVPIGRRDFEVKMLGYQKITIPDVQVTTGKIVVLTIELEESFTQITAIEITATDKSGTLNEMSSVSARLFRIEETERYPGSRQDPARMASNFAGVQGSNDTRNDIVVRGNSPSSTLWRVEDIDIPNPNHFAVPGSMGGPVSIINNKYLGNSDFLTGAFPSMYSNANGGVFDIKMRNGNQERFENTFQFGVLGTELTSEGPISRSSRASYIATYRYSTLDMLQGLNLKIGTDAVPQYQDAGFRLNFPTKKAGTWTVWGIGGLSKIDIVVSDKSFADVIDNESYGDKNRDQYFSTGMGVLAISNVLQLSGNTFMKTSLAQSAQQVNANHDLIIRDTSSQPIQPFPKILDYTFKEAKTTLSWFIHSKLSNKSSLRAGLFANCIEVNYHDQVKIIGLKDSIPQLVTDSVSWKVRENYKGTFFLIQPYIQWKYRIGEALTLNAGIASQISTLNNQATVEPRLGIRWNLDSRQTISLGAGLHSQTQLTYLYFAIPDTLVKAGVKTANIDRERANQKIGFTKSIHIVGGYDFTISKNFRIKAETYFQTLYDVPVYAVSSGVSLINQGATFTRFFPQYTLDNTGTGQNYGVELTIEKFFSQHYFFLISGSLYNSTYTASNGKSYNSDYNGNFIVNALGGIDYPVGKRKKNSFGSSTKVTYAGGRRYSPVNIDASAAIYDVVPLESAINSQQFPNYFRWDIRISYKINQPKKQRKAQSAETESSGKSKGFTHEIAVDLVNILNIRNVLALSYSPDPRNLKGDPLVKNYQLGFLPLFYYKLDF